MARVEKEQSLRDFQRKIAEIYAVPDDRSFSIYDLLTQKQRFTMRALKGIRKGDTKKLTDNLLFAFSWLMTIANRMHIDVEDEMWKRFPGACLYCGTGPCSCKKVKSSKRKQVKPDPSLRPKTLAEFQALCGFIYPPKRRTLAEEGIHLAEETGEVSEAIHNFLGQHLKKQFVEVGAEIADYAACLFAVANAANIAVAPKLAQMFKKGCHVCHKTPCECTFTAVTSFHS